MRSTFTQALACSVGVMLASGCSESGETGAAKTTAPPAAQSTRQPAAAETLASRPATSGSTEARIETDGPFAGLRALSTEGTREFAGLFSIYFGEFVAGQERFAVQRAPNGDRLIDAQTAYNQDDGFTVTMSHQLSSDGTEDITMILAAEQQIAHLHLHREARRLSIKGQTNSGNVHEHYDVDPDVLVTGRAIAAETLVVARLADLAVGQTVTLRRKMIGVFPGFQVVDSSLTYRRLPDEQVELSSGEVVPARSYEAFRQAAPDKSIMTLVADESGGLILADTVQPTGKLSFVRDDGP